MPFTVEQLVCPKCMQNDITLVGNHYVCNNPDCYREDGSKTQFTLKFDEKIQFPYNQIFVDRTPDEFYRQPYLEIKTIGAKLV